MHERGRGWSAATKRAGALARRDAPALVAGVPATAPRPPRRPRVRPVFLRLADGPTGPGTARPGRTWAIRWPTPGRLAELGLRRSKARIRGRRAPTYRASPLRSRLPSFEAVALALDVFDVVHLAKHGPDVIYE